MAIDTAEKRRSAAGALLRWWGPGVTPNADKDSEWRAQAAFSYSGITYASAGEAPAVAQVKFVYRRRRRLRAKKLNLGV